MSWVAVAVGVGSMAAGIYGSKKAADAQSDAAASAAGTQRYMYDQTRDDQAPFREAGVNALGQLTDLSGLEGAGAREAAVNQFYQDPGYQFRFGEGQRALQNSAAARGDLFSGNTGRELVGFGQGMGSGEYGNYYGRLENLAGIGQTATNQLGTLGAGAAGRIGNAQLAQGQARGSGYIGMTDALSSGLNSFAGYQGWNQPGSNWGGGGGYGGRPAGFGNTAMPQNFGYTPQWGG